ncbi:VOC family protein [Isobaculum melis]|uniref:Catechol 2,3-dioxygenase n=1 Tax=Isobaculum melis TaxID=142588 RepID=A0A1H9RWE0_9LACT|nr:VOC family protein [Isobaculum melis]SER77122.1 Catechol 2,3-dioxygenase [Isobaculum melis]
MTGLHHLEIYVGDLQRSRQFYQYLLPKLGYTLFQEWQAGFSYQATDGSYLVFVQTNKEYLANGYHRCNIGLNHLAFQVASKKEVDDFQHELKLRNVTLLYEENYPFAGGENHYAVFFEDPDKIKLEIVSK